ncbi:PTS transporter subunit EIIC [Fusobacterium sp. SYSU M8A802]
MAQIKNYPKLALEILKEINGKENIINISRCATRLRLILKETPNDLKERIESLTGVITTVEKGGQFQIVIGTNVGKVYDEIMKVLGDNLNTNTEIHSQQPILNRVIATMSGVFAPFVYILAAAGILQGLLILINLITPNFSTTGTYEILSFISWTPFSFLPILIAITASKHFKCNTYIAVTCCAALINPTWIQIAGRIANGENLSFLFFKLNSMTYHSTVLPPLFLVWLLSYLEKWLEKKIPEVIRALMIPFICIIIMVPLTILLIGPITNSGANIVSIGFNYLMEKSPMLGGILISGFWQIFVIFGIHWGVTPMVMANFANNGYDYFHSISNFSSNSTNVCSFWCILKN